MRRRQVSKTSSPPKTNTVAAAIHNEAVGFWKNFDELRANWGKDKEWIPKMDAKLREGLYSGWKKAVTRTFDWVE